MIDRLKKSLQNKMSSNNKDSSIQLKSIQIALQELKILEGKKLSAQNIDCKEIILNDLNKAEFKVFSQWGDDGIIQFLVEHLAIENKIFVEFGVENYEESNTRFLLLNNCWNGLVIDGLASNVAQIKSSTIYWQYQLEAKCSFITKENINELISSYTQVKEIGLLVIDVDGNDYWIWESIENINPVIVVDEYNSLFGNKRAITIPYEANFKRTSAHFSNLYYGASLGALQLLGAKKDYVLVACNNNGNNAFFVRKDKLKQLKELEVDKAYKKATFRESRNEANKLTYLNLEDAAKLIQGLLVVNVKTGQTEPF